MSVRLAVIVLCSLCSLLVINVVAIQRRSNADDDRKEEVQTHPQRDKWMIVKLTAQQILEYLTTGNMEKLEESARRMQVINFMEQWSRDSDFVRKSDYQGQLNAFEFATKELIRHAKANDVDAVLHVLRRIDRIMRALSPVDQRQS